MDSLLRIFDDNVILINPRVDCSDKEMHQRNGFKSAGQNLFSFFKNGNKAHFSANVFKPQQLGEFTKDNQGVIKHMTGEANKPQFIGREGAFGGGTLEPIHAVNLTRDSTIRREATRISGDKGNSTDPRGAL